MDWAFTRRNEHITAYKRIKKAKESFLRYMLCVERLNHDSPYQQLWSSILQAAYQYFGSVWWPCGPFHTNISGIPNSDDVHRGCQALRSILEALLLTEVVQPEA